jgi:chaperonin cofactor prefoldin
VNKTNLTLALNLIMETMDNRMKTLEENQSKIVISLSSFLGKINKVFFKGKQLLLK